MERGDEPLVPGEKRAKIGLYSKKITSNVAKMLPFGAVVTSCVTIIPRSFSLVKSFFHIFLNFFHKTIAF